MALAVSKKMIILLSHVIQKPSHIRTICLIPSIIFIFDTSRGRLNMISLLLRSPKGVHESAGDHWNYSIWLLPIVGLESSFDNNEGIQKQKPEQKWEYKSSSVGRVGTWNSDQGEIGKIGANNIFPKNMVGSLLSSEESQSLSGWYHAKENNI